MTLEQSVRENPMNWKDWVNALALLITLAAVLVQGGRLLESQAVANAKLAELNLRLHTLSDQHAGTQRDITQLRGVDAVHDEQIKHLRSDVDTVKTRARR